MAEIYALFSSRDGLVRYVGKTFGSHANRFEQHKRTVIGRSISPVLPWLRHEWQCGYPVESALIEECSDADCESIETGWMNKFPRWRFGFS